MITATAQAKDGHYLRECLDEDLWEKVKSLNMIEKVAYDLSQNIEWSSLTDRLVRMIIGDRPDILRAKAFASLEVVERIKSVLKTYNVSPLLMEVYGLEDGWQDKIPDFVIQAIAEQTATVMHELDRGIVEQEIILAVPSKKVFIVEDDNELCEKLKQHLTENSRFIVSGTADGATKALEEIKNDPPDVIILDYVLNEKDGAAFLTELKQYFTVLPYVVGMSGAENFDAIENIDALGLDMFIDKNERDFSAENVVDIMVSDIYGELLTRKIMQKDVPFNSSNTTNGAV